ncbi:OmpA family protein [Fulvivirgaceae bacterium BMA10]|uniref:OmpA family protein n=1 Tax=Splendidivirga corallicola TaxID=3051826 RepID=A0ABT8KIH5_9BACT|nr:OmpA family protein [Fulvivirgaceae bacterium BMA10]
MLKRIFVTAFIIAATVCITFQTEAQNTESNSKLITKAEKLFRVRNYKEALKTFLEATGGQSTDPIVNYEIGLCYYHEDDLSNRVKGIPFLKKAVAGKDQNIPNIIFYELGELYHKDEKIEEAIASFEKYKKSLDSYNKKEIKKVNFKLKICKNALLAIGNPKDVNIQSFHKPINSEFTEYNPVVAADQSVMAFTVLRPNTDRVSSSQEFIEEIYVSYQNLGGSWTEPEMVDIKSKFNVGTAGISHDGERMLVFVGDVNNTGNLYKLNKKAEGWSQPVPLDRGINSNFLESTASLTPDGKTIYFASNRSGGYGGMDIYKAEKQENGNWGNVKNLGPTVNSKADEDAPFIHPDGKTLFFTSNGENSIGGNDIFKTVFLGQKWIEPKNMGYPINTTANDNYFTLTADGSKAYFSSDRKGGKGLQDIYSMDMPESERNIPLTLIKGRILAGEDLKPVPTKIKVINKKTNKKVDYVYNPNKETGNYLIIFPPGENYDMVIESDGYLPYTLNVNVPNQDYFYELYQQIHLKTIEHFGVVVGQEVDVRNAFYDTKKGEKAQPRKVNDAMLVANDSIDLYDVMDGIISSGDTAAYEYLLDIMFSVNPIDAIDFNDLENSNIEAARRIYYYDETDDSKLEAKTIDGTTVYSLPTLFVTELAEVQRNKKDLIAKDYDDKLLSQISKVYFDQGNSKLRDEFKVKLDAILGHLKNHQALGIEISGFASAEGDMEYNRKLSDERAISVLNYFNKKGVVRRRIVAKGYGATQTNEDEKKEEGRRVEVKLIDLNNL